MRVSRMEAALLGALPHLGQSPGSPQPLCVRSGGHSVGEVPRWPGLPCCREGGGNGAGVRCLGVMVQMLGPSKGPETPRWEGMCPGVSCPPCWTIGERGRGAFAGTSRFLRLQSCALPQRKAALPCQAKAGLWLKLRADAWADRQEKWTVQVRWMVQVTWGGDGAGQVGCPEGKDCLAGSWGLGGAGCLQLQGVLPSPGSAGSACDQSPRCGSPSPPTPPTCTGQHGMGSGGSPPWPGPAAQPARGQDPGCGAGAQARPGHSLCLHMNRSQAGEAGPDVAPSSSRHTDVWLGRVQTGCPERALG